jgi:hypothetical protein
MKLVMTLLVRDLADIVAANLAYHLARGVDHIIVTDNGSVDGSREIVAAYAATGRVTLIDEPDDDYDQSAWVTRMARMAHAMGADWVINNDCDELWWSDGGGLNDIFAAVPAHVGSVLVPRANMLPLRALNAHPFEAMVLREAQSFNGLARPLQPKAAHRAAADVEVAPGNHEVHSAALGATVATDRILIFHYPHRSYGQLRRKIELGGAAVERNTRYDRSMFDVWRSLHKLLQENRLRDWYDALPHADDPDIETRLRSGVAVRDDRVARYLRERLPTALATPLPPA